MEGYLGTILPVGLQFAPRNWSDCNGQVLNVSQNAALFSLLGAIYGGDGRATFALPNLLGRFPLGFGTTPGTANNFTQGATGGVSSVTLTANNLPQHVHPATASASVTMSGMSVTLPPFNATASTNTQVQAVNGSGAQPAATLGSYLSGVTAEYGGDTVPAKLYATSPSAGTVTLGGVSSTTSVSVTPGGPAGVAGAPSASVAVAVGANSTTSNPLPTMPPYTAVRFIIAVQGLYPSRN
ncbi:MAG: phage tail protein [Methylococcaceae bacterium]|nr:phage tail protein [Methylococcaceae bacterium]